VVVIHFLMGMKLELCFIRLMMDIFLGRILEWESQNSFIFVAVLPEMHLISK